jgi:cysteine desulfurase
MLYLDYNATTPVDPEVAEFVTYLMRDEYGNAGSRTHEFGLRAKRIVQRAREQVANVVSATPDEVIFTSGATESNNLSILGLYEHAERTKRLHIVSTTIEHKAVLEPLAELERRGVTVTRVPVDETGRVDPAAIGAALRPETILVSVMHANNETGVIQPLPEIIDLLTGHDAYFHVDAAQTYGKLSGPLRSPRIDLLSVSGHKLYAPKGIGALIMRRRHFKRPPLRPLMFGGGQEGGLRPGTLPVPLAGALGFAAEKAALAERERWDRCAAERARMLSAFARLNAQPNGDQASVLPHVINISVPGVDSEAGIVVLKDLVAISNGSACTSHTYAPSHVLAAMGLSATRIASALRISWGPETNEIPWSSIVARLASASVAVG